MERKEFGVLKYSLMPEIPHLMRGLFRVHVRPRIKSGVAK